ncbi:hypothetical protein KsCSTR_18240 [Candidatus Kuenenia stuttgartiensis]|uniref:Uncharacterized protein n=1 Tax=Kuenenia stuttgartiensis TaxID=174633 RepID=A0A6G7GPF2_KUEST|nr:type II toxin-antitoxin system MqsR family toxin [Candidatus Kuenenia stuttgartiensis]QII11203.1 hypothetical protein KsCSTR_18240 [Candidatus Kuenenia stuttgartiensis]
MGKETKYTIIARSILNDLAEKGYSLEDVVNVIYELWGYRSGLGVKFMEREFHKPFSDFTDSFSILES